MKKLIFPLSLIFLCSLFVSGCDLAQPQRQEQGVQPVVQDDPQPVEVPGGVPVEQHAPPQDAEDETVLVRAAPGMTGRGNYASATANNPMGIITVPVSQYFRVQDRLVLQQIEHAINLFRATHDRLPASQEEFMTDIIRANNIALPRLPDGHTYVYEEGELKVRRPRDAQ